jgi:hypothetical protein
MKLRTMQRLWIVGLLATVGAGSAEAKKARGDHKGSPPAVAKPKPAKTKNVPPVAAEAPLDPFVQKGAAWLVKAQHPGGGWGAGSHARQEVRDPHAVVTDPATTAFVAMALLRAGSTPESGPYSDAMKRATLYLLEAVEKAPQGPKITHISGTQPQAKLGPLVDTGMTSQYLARVLPHLTKGTSLHQRVDTALERCIRKLEESQSASGSWNSGSGWAPVLESSVSTSALEMAQVAGKAVDPQKLEKARQYQKGRFDAESGRAESRDAAGVELYAYTSAQRANAAEAAEAQQKLQDAKDRGDLPAAAPVSEDNLKKAGVAGAQAKVLNDAYRSNQSALRRLSDEQLLSGFGNNGGEEYLSYLQTSESLALSGGSEWTGWKQKMTVRLSKIQGDDGSWSGHHCITSPVFCTAAVLQTLTADRGATARQHLASVTK